MRAVIFDFDGVIVDTEPLHWRAFHDVLRDEGLAFSWEEYTGFYIGFDDRDAFREVYRRAGITVSPDLLRDRIARKAAAFQRLMASDPPRPYPGVLERLREISGRLPLALCSGALRADILPVFARFGLGEVFDAVVTADDVHVSKPDPACYRKALELLNNTRDQEIPPGGCLAVEDTAAGISAAKGAGMRVLAVSNSHPPQALAAADRVVDSLGSFTLNDMRIWFSTLR